MKNLLFAIIIITRVFGQYPDAKSVLVKIDENMSSKSQIIESTMVIHGIRSSRSITSKSWIEGTDKSFTEYLAPAREKGTKMLKLEDQLWMYSPQSDRTIRISGHMLRQSVMGSDLSYEDMMEDRNLQDVYDAKIIGEDEIDGSTCWIMELSSIVDDLAYHSQKLWVDQEKYIYRKQQLFAKSGKLLKVIEISELFQVDDRWYPKRMLFQDVLKKGKGTEFIVESVEFDQVISDHIFSKASLRK
jgi:outer membrane lipoprotein-sorting protein